MRPRAALRTASWPVRRAGRLAGPAVPRLTRMLMPASLARCRRPVLNGFHGLARGAFEMFRPGTEIQVHPGRMNRAGGVSRLQPRAGSATGRIGSPDEARFARRRTDPAADPRAATDRRGAAGRRRRARGAAMTIFTVRHLTTYRYKRPVSFGRHRMMFRPRDSYDQKLIFAEIEINPRPKNIYWTHDVFWNCITTAEFGTEAAKLSFLSNIRLDHSPSSAPDFRIEDYARTYPFSYSPEEMPDLMPSIARQYADPEHAIHRWARRFLRDGGPTDTGKLLMTLTYAIKETLVYERRSEIGTWNPALTLQLGRGTCRDFALLMIEAVRPLGLAARFVSGYIYVP